MKKLYWPLFWLFIAAFVFLFFGLPIISWAKKPKTERYYCPVCDAEIDYDAEPEYLENWLNEKGYDLVYKDDAWDYVWDYVNENPDVISEYLYCNQDWINDILYDNATDYLEDCGWTLIPPKENN